MDRRRPAAVAAAVVVAAGGAVKFGDDVGALVRIGAHEHPPPVHVEPPPIHVEPPPPVPIDRRAETEAQIRTAIDDFAATATIDADAPAETARETARKAACAILFEVAKDGRLPTDGEWTTIALGVLEDAFIDVPVGSDAWRALDRVKREISTAVTGPSGDPDTEEAESLIGDFACS